MINVLATLFFGRRQVINEVYLLSFSHDVVGPFLEFASIKPVADTDLQIRGVLVSKKVFFGPWCLSLVQK